MQGPAILGSGVVVARFGKNKVFAIYFRLPWF
jgi:hypothetical protein